MESDREALLLRKAIGQSAYAVMEAERGTSQLANSVEDENVNSSNNSSDTSPMKVGGVSQEAEESSFSAEMSPPTTPLKQPSPPLPPNSDTSTNSNASVNTRNSVSSQPKHMDKIVAMLARSEEYAKQELEGTSHTGSPNRGLSDTDYVESKVNMTAHLPPVVIDSIKDSFNAHVPHHP